MCISASPLKLPESWYDDRMELSSVFRPPNQWKIGNLPLPDRQAGIIAGNHIINYLNRPQLR
jgi:hypothetical protein